MTPLLVFLGGAVVAGVAGWLHLKREVERRTALAGFAASNGWTFEAEDTSGLAHRWSAAPFGIGHSRRATNVLRGTVDDRPLVAFDYRYKVTTDTGKSRRTRTFHYAVAALELPGYLPSLEVGPENVLTRLGNVLGLDDVELESEDFNRAFRVRGSARFAHDVLHPRTMTRLLRGGCASWRLGGTDIVGWDEGRQTPSELIARVATMSDVVDGIPGFVWRDHGYDPGTGGATRGGRG